MGEKLRVGRGLNSSERELSWGFQSWLCKPGAFWGCFFLWGLDLLSALVWIKGEPCGPQGWETQAHILPQGAVVFSSG